MSSVAQPDYEPRQQAPVQPLDVLIRAVLLGGLALLCYRVFSPFLTLTVWSIILITMDVLIIWALTVHGREVRA